MGPVPRTALTQLPCKQLVRGFLKAYDSDHRHEYGCVGENSIEMSQKSTQVTSENLIATRPATESGLAPTRPLAGLINETCDVVTVQRALVAKHHGKQLCALWPGAIDSTRNAAGSLFQAALNTAADELGRTLDKWLIPESSIIEGERLSTLI